jgi:hypothetical protein
MEAAHGNGDSTDDRLENLRWATPTGNNQDKTKHGTQPHGEQILAARITVDQARTVKARLAAGQKKIEIARELGIAPGIVYKISYGRTWKRA